MGVRPNIVVFHADNLGSGEFSCHSGGPLRGATTQRIDPVVRSATSGIPVNPSVTRNLTEES